MQHFRIKAQIKTYFVALQIDHVTRWRGPEPQLNTGLIYRPGQQSVDFDT